MCLDSFIRRTWRRGSHTPLLSLWQWGSQEGPFIALWRSWRGLGALRELLGVDHLPLSCRTLQGSGWQRPQATRLATARKLCRKYGVASIFICHQSTQEGGVTWSATRVRKVRRAVPSLCLDRRSAAEQWSEITASPHHKLSWCWGRTSPRMSRSWLDRRFVSVGCT